MKRLSVTIAISLSSLLLMAFGCGGGGGGGGSDGDTGVGLDSLSGIWFGSFESVWESSYDTLKFNINASGHINSIFIGGIQYDDHTGTIAKEDDNSFSLTISDGTVGGFYVDDSAEHAVYVDEDFYFAVLEKGATSLPSYIQTDAVGSWSGFTVNVDAGLNFLIQSNSSAAVTPSFFLSGSTPAGAFSGDFLSWVESYGAFQGVFSGGDGVFEMFVSPDRQFAGMWACIIPGTFPIDCGFSAWWK